MAAGAAQTVITKEGASARMRRVAERAGMIAEAPRVHSADRASEVTASKVAVPERRRTKM